MASNDDKQDPNNIPEILQRTAVHPKRKGIVTSVPLRSRFMKARPNINLSGTKTVKETSVQSVDNSVKPCEAVKEQASNDRVAEAPSRPSILPKKTSSVPCAPRARFQKARPNIGLLLNKSPKINDAPDTEVKNSPSIADTATKEVVSPIEKSPVRIESAKLSNEKQNPVEVEAVLQESDSPALQSSEAAADAESPEEQQVRSEPEVERPETTSNEKENSSALASKSGEYPTLRSILNAPRKRAATKKAFERRKKFVGVHENPAQSDMKMSDLIYWTPRTSPMKRAPKTRSEPADDPLPPDDPPEEEEAEGGSFAPKVVLNEAGEIILDESSLVVKRKEGGVDSGRAVVLDNEDTTYSSFRTRLSRQWTLRETEKFYTALSLIGTDFALMENIFTVNGKVTRTRKELKLKFKREEKLRTDCVHKAMYESHSYDLKVLEEEEGGEEEADEPPKKRGRKPKTADSETKQKKKRKKSADNDFDYSQTEKGVVQMEKKKAVDSSLLTEEENSENKDPAERKHVADIKIYDDHIDSCEELSPRNENFPDASKENGTEVDRQKNATTTSRSGRVRRVKNLPDYVMDGGYISDSVLEEEEEDMELILPDNGPASGVAPCALPPDALVQDVVCVRGEGGITLRVVENDDRCVERIGNQLKLLPPGRCDPDLLTDAEISEVVTTSRGPPKKRRRMKKEPPALPGNPNPGPPPTFSAFTPSEEASPMSANLRTYSRGRRGMHLIQEAPPLRTGTNPSSRPESSAAFSPPPWRTSSVIVSPSTPRTSELTPLDSEIEEVVPPSLSSLHVPACTPDRPSSSSTLQTSFARGGQQRDITLPMTPGSHIAPPVMIFTKSPSNENILHLFMVKNS